MLYRPYTPKQSPGPIVYYFSIMVYDYLCITMVTLSQMELWKLCDITYSSHSRGSDEFTDWVSLVTKGSTYVQQRNSKNYE